MSLGIEPSRDERARTRDRTSFENRQDGRGFGRHRHHHRNSTHHLIVDAHTATTDDGYRTTVAVFKKAKKARQAELDELRDQIRDLTSQLATLSSSQASTSSQIDDLVTRIGSLDGRITQVGTEVTHQLGELSGDIDSLAQRTTTMNDEIGQLGDVTSIVDEVRTDQARLANEQARYEIAFRQDLAELAERLQRQRPNG